MCKLIPFFINETYLLYTKVSVYIYKFINWVQFLLLKYIIKHIIIQNDTLKIILLKSYC